MFETCQNFFKCLCKQIFFFLLLAGTETRGKSFLDDTKMMVQLSTLLMSGEEASSSVPVVRSVIRTRPVQTLDWSGSEWIHCNHKHEDKPKALLKCFYKTRVSEFYLLFPRVQKEQISDFKSRIEHDAAEFSSDSRLKHDSAEHQQICGQIKGETNKLPLFIS